MDFWKIFFKQTNKMTIFGSLFELPHHKNETMYSDKHMTHNFRYSTYYNYNLVHNESSIHNLLQYKHTYIEISSENYRKMM